MPKITRKGRYWIVVLGYVSLTVILTVATTFFGSPIAGALIGVALSLLSEAGRVAKERIDGGIKAFVNNDDTAKCRILIYGIPRSGKTSIIRRILTHGQPRHETSTADFDVYEDDVRLDLKGSKYPVAFADYKGQKPGQIIVGPPETFFGEQSERRINAILFVVDLFPEFPDEKEEPEQFREFMRKIEEDTSRHISERVAANLRYVNEFSIQPVFQVAYSPNSLFAVRLVINKIDVLRDLAAKGHIVGLDASAVNEYAQNQYNLIVRALKKACSPENLNVPNFSVEVVSAYTGENLTEMFSGIVSAYSERMRP